MKTIGLILFGASLLFLQSADSHATGVYQGGYRFPFDGMAFDSGHVETFVIREHAAVTGPYPVRAGRFPALALRASQDILPGPQTTKKEPQGTDQGDRHRAGREE